jgi:hypothetical protein
MNAADAAIVRAIIDPAVSTGKSIVSADLIQALENSYARMGITKAQVPRPHLVSAGQI